MNTVRLSRVLITMRRIISQLFLLFIVCALPAQEGIPLLTHFKESREIENQSWAICQDINNVMLFANRKGILSFDGQDWLSVRIPTIPFSMQTNPSDGRIFIGGDNNYGFLEKDQMGAYKYVSLSADTSDIGVITKIVFNDSVVWFFGEQSVSRYNLENEKLELRLKSKDTYPFTGIFITNKNTFFNVMNKGLFKLENDTLSPVVSGYPTEKVEILFSLPYNNRMVLVGFSNGKLLLFDGIKYYDYQIKDDGYLNENILSEGIAIGDSLYAFSTLDGGAMVVDKISGKIRFTINNQNGLPDDEIFAVGLDKNGGLWLSHQYGLTRADLNLPVGNFSIYPGLKGNLTTSLWYENELYVATSGGVYYLTEVKNYSEVQVLVKNEVFRPLIEKTPEKEPEQKSRRKNIFTRIFGRKIAKDKNVTSSDSTGIMKDSSTGSKEIQYTRKTVNRLKSVNYIFKKIEGFNEKCRQLVGTRKGILAGTNKGLYNIINHKAVLIAKNRYVNFISWQPAGEKYYVAAGDGYFSVKYKNGNWSAESVDPGYNFPVYSIINTSSTTLWLGVDNAALRADLSKGPNAVRYTTVSIKNDFPQRYILDLINDTVFLYTESGIYFYDNRSEGFIQSRPDKSSSVSKVKYLYPLSNMPWIRHGDDWIYLKTIDKEIEREMSLFKIFNEVISINAENNNIWIVDAENRLFRIDLKKQLKINPEIDVFIKSIYDEKGSTFNLSNIVLYGGDNIINFDIVAPGYLKQNTTQYQYTINKLMPDWSPWSVRTNYNLMIPGPGEYKLNVRAKDLWGNVGAPESVKFTIKASFTQTTLFYFLSAFVILLFLFLIVRFREGHFQKKNKILEDKVKERTAEIAAQKQEITSSIEYASRIQMAMIPVEDHFKEFFSDHFIIFKPRDIVSGDFYWIGEDDKHIFFTVADCTGHGVPGAFMSTLGISSLNEIITNNKDLQANTVLNLLRDKIITSLHQTGKEGEAADGMDLALCVIHKNKKTLQYSGAYNPMFIFQAGEFKEYKADRMPIGIYYGEKRTFTNYEIKLKKGDTIYIFSDGYTDQFGGPEGVKYKISNLKKLVSEIYYRPMTEQRNIIEHEFRKWRGSSDQVDDITMIGVRI
jgi:serine phosphatase RsbU (regulator of sigma subunit)/ligand-binding sensor domain-containing protein